MEDETPPLRDYISTRELGSRAGKTLKRDATPEECAKLATLFDLLAVDAFASRIEIARYGRSGWRISGRITGKVTQSCIISLAPVPGTIDEPFERLFEPEASPADRIGAEVLVSPDDAEMPEPLGDGIDLADILLETFALALEPYPRAPGAVLERNSARPAGAPALEDEPPAKPFAGLAKLISGGEKDT